MAVRSTVDFGHRYRVGWHVLVGAVALPLAVAIAADVSVALGQRLLALGTLAVIVACYALVAPRAMENRDERWGAAYFAVLAVAFPLLLAIAPIAGALLFALCPQLFVMVTRWRVRLPLLSVLYAELAWAMVARAGVSRYTPAMVGVTVLVPMTVTILVGAYLTGIREQNRRRAALIEELTRTRAALERAGHAAGVHAERERLAAEIHDTLAQGFTSILMLAQVARTTLLRDPTAADGQLDILEKTARENLAEARSLIAASAPVDLTGRGLADALDRLAARHARDTGTRVEVSIVGERSGTSTATDIALLRTAQEGLANVAKHAAATTVRIELRQEPDLMALAVTDDGQGFDPATVRGGYGLLGMRTRASGLGGTCTVRSAPGQGTTVRVELPPPPAEQAARSLRPVPDLSSTPDH
ncbi:sensor histidine kinase [Streptomyces sp. IBSBF 2953]|uniref:sensor histidine kinase n=1 Tax=Streptomyces TaxID=1883 RepID=UPI002119D08E|nr:sensor histidine kinase [Streptomyces scabiei]MCQ9179365.1 sensor histidine kinase [Streptomyces hayashii]MDX3111936.1 sensor histidine kinase [Streptomyces scabiei]